ncbi:MAG: hypothetical protein ABJN34_06695 [Litoreibacter sp.]|uniref:hypothetical protein n=1 Tax=Litoreibacter sp. TaxID=1969459 RepID=UPI003299F700
MKLKDIEPHLTAVFNSDQAKLTDLRRRQLDLELTKTELSNSFNLAHEEAISFEQSVDESRYQNWKRQEIENLDRSINELQSGIDTSKKNLKRSFGKLEALRHVLEGDDD